LRRPARRLEASDISTEEAVPDVGRQEPAVELLLRFARLGHDAGYPTADLEERVLALAETLGVPGAQVSATPTMIDLSVGTLPGQRSYALRVRPSPVELDAIARLDGVVQRLLDGELDADAASGALDEIQVSPLQRRWQVRVAAYAVAGAALTPILGGGWREALAAAVVGLIVGGVALLAGKMAGTEPIVAPLAAATASFSAVTLATVGLDASPDVVTLAALVTFLPGMRLTIGVRELSTDHLQSGVANTASALIQLLGLVVGVGVGRSIALNWFGPVEATAPRPSFSVFFLFAAVAAGVAFTVTLGARYRDASFMCGAAVLAVGANELGTQIFGRTASAFVAALAVGIAGGVVAFVFRRSPLVFVVPGVLMLVPGSAGFNSVLQLLADQTVAGITAGFDTFVTAMSIAYGLLVSTLVLPRRLTSLSRARDRPAVGGSRS
jgi:uncharacterized membrane protein YjjP (DUF1212 family)